MRSSLFQISINLKNYLGVIQSEIFLPRHMSKGYLTFEVPQTVLLVPLRKNEPECFSTVALVLYTSIIIAVFDLIKRLWILLFYPEFDGYIMNTITLSQTD